MPVFPVIYPTVRFRIDPNGYISDLGPEWEDMTGIPRSTVLRTGVNEWLETPDPAYTFEEWVKAHTCQLLDIRLKRRSGPSEWVVCCVDPEAFEGDSFGVTGWLFDHNDSIRICREMQNGGAGSETFLPSRPCFTMNHDGTILAQNESYKRFFDARPGSDACARPPFFPGQEDEATIPTEILRVLRLKGFWIGRAGLQDFGHPETAGTDMILDLRVVNGFSGNEGGPFYFGTLYLNPDEAPSSDESFCRIKDQRDTLTGLPDRNILTRRLEQAITQSRDNQSIGALVYIDMDNFKEVNDAIGREQGNDIILIVARRVRNILQKTDTVHRPGGDEFVILLENIRSVEDIPGIVERIREAIIRPIRLSTEIINIQASIGVTVFPDDSGDSDQLIRHADQAMVAAKQQGGDQIQFFDNENNRRLAAQSSEMRAVHGGIRNDEFVLYYQPKISIASGEVIGMEALIRWQSPQRGFLNPGAFLPYIEGTSVTQDLDRHVLGLALRQIEAWSAQGIDVPISVNIGVDLLQSADFVPMIREMLSRHPSVAPDRIELEVLETGAIDDIQGISATLKEIRDLGVGLALDDFGTGYSSLAYLKRLPTDTLKIDRTFVRDMLEDPEDLNIIDGVISLSKAFHRTVIAEGVETREHGRVLFERGCSQGQGFGIARPMPAEEVPDWLTQWAQSESEGWRFEKLAAGQN